MAAFAIFKAGAVGAFSAAFADVFAAFGAVLPAVGTLALVGVAFAALGAGKLFKAFFAMLAAITGM